MREKARACRAPTSVQSPPPPPPPPLAAAGLVSVGILRRHPWAASAAPSPLQRSPFTAAASDTIQITGNPHISKSPTSKREKEDRPGTATQITMHPMARGRAGRDCMDPAPNVEASAAAGTVRGRLSAAAVPVAALVIVVMALVALPWRILRFGPSVRARRGQRGVPQWHDSFMRGGKKRSVVRSLREKKPSRSRKPTHMSGLGAMAAADLGPWWWSAEHKTLLCLNPKSGTTSFQMSLYTAMAGGLRWPRWRPDGSPYTELWQMHTRKGRGIWNNTWTKPSSEVLQRVFAAPGNDYFSFALIRDPRQRILSAWGSKIACDGNGTKVDVMERGKIVRTLLEQAGMRPEGRGCLGLTEFLRTLSKLHEWSSEDIEILDYLDGHFRPQHRTCFAHFPPQNWTRVGVISDDKAMQELAARVAPSGAKWAVLHENSCREAGLPALARKFFRMNWSHFALHCLEGLRRALHNFVAPIETTEEDVALLAKITAGDMRCLRQFLRPVPL